MCAHRQTYTTIKINPSKNSVSNKLTVAFTIPGALVRPMGPSDIRMSPVMAPVYNSSRGDGVREWEDGLWGKSKPEIHNKTV